MTAALKTVRTGKSIMFAHFQTAVCVAAIAAATGWTLPAVTPAKAQTSGVGNYIKLNEAAIGETRRISVGLNKSMVIDLPGDAHDILVANPEVADAITRSSRRIYIFAKQVGETNIFIFDAAGKQLLSIDLVIERDIAGLEANLAKYIPGSEIKVEMVNDNVILTGTVPTPQASARAVDLARIFVTGGEATTNQFDTASLRHRRHDLSGRRERAAGQPDRQPAADRRRGPGQPQGDDRRNPAHGRQAARHRPVCRRHRGRAQLCLLRRQSLRAQQGGSRIRAGRSATSMAATTSTRSFARSTSRA